jgi:hypothetical protein
MPLVITAVGSTPMGDDSDVVACRIDERVAGPLVVKRGVGEPFARLLSSGPIVAAARAVVELYTLPPPGLSLADVNDALDALVRAVAAVDAVPIGGAIESEPEPRELQFADPTQMLLEAGNRLLYGNPEGKDSDTFKSPFRALALAGVVVGSTPLGEITMAFGVTLGQADAVDALEPLAERLGEMSSDLAESAESFRTAFVTPKKESEASS